LREWIAMNLRHAGFGSPTTLARATRWHRSTTSGLLGGCRSIATDRLEMLAHVVGATPARLIARPEES
jgi:hypothetical protein